MAWLHAAPKQFKDEKDPKARFDILEDDDPVKQLPETDKHMTTCFRLMGFASSSGMGLMALSWSDIKSFCDQSAYKLDGWESEQIIMMSRAYCSMKHESAEIGFPAPFNQAASDENALEKNRSIVEAKFRAMRGRRSK